jgi:hypothetical protein
LYDNKKIFILGMILRGKLMQWWIRSLLLLVLTPMMSFADDLDQVGEGWPVEQRCAPIVAPRDDWQFEGTVIARGWAGLHGMNARFDTPYILAFDSDWLQDFADGSLSPDRRWYAVPHGTSRFVDYPASYLSIHYMTVTQLAIYDLVNPDNHYIMPWDYQYQARANLVPTVFGYFYAYKAPVWMDETTLFYASGRAVGGWFSPKSFHIIDVENRTVETLKDSLYGRRIDLTHILSVFPAPDWSRFAITDTGSIALASLSDDDLVYVYETLVYNHDNLELAWHPASTELIISGREGVFIVDRDGNPIDVISAQPDDFYLFYNESAYSPDGEWMYFWTRISSWTYNYLLANRADRVLVDTCLEFSSAVFSPDGRYMAGLMNVDKTQPELHIFDRDRWEVYPTGIYHEGSLIGWGDW